MALLTALSTCVCYNMLTVWKLMELHCIQKDASCFAQATRDSMTIFGAEKTKTMPHLTAFQITCHTYFSWKKNKNFGHFPTYPQQKATLGDFTFWLKPFAERFAELKFGLRPDLSQKVKRFRWAFRWVETSVLDRSFGSAKGSAKGWDEKYGLSTYLDRS